MSAISSRFWRYSLFTLGGLIALIAILLTLITLAIYTEAGSRRVTLAVLARVNALDGINLQSGGISGNLLSGLTLSDATLEIPAANVKAGSIRAAWNPWSILSGSFYLSELSIDNLTVTLLEVPAEIETVVTDPLSVFRLQALPINIAVGSLTMANAALVSGEQQFDIQSLSLAASLNGQELEINDLHLQARPLTVDLSLQASLRDNIPLLASINWEYQGHLFANYELAVGTAAITGDLTQLVVQHELLAPEPIHSDGTITAPLSNGELALSFSNSIDFLRLPWAVTEEYMFNNVLLDTQWSGGDVALNLQSSVTAANLPDITLAANGAVNTTSLQIADMRIATATGELTGDGQLDWSDRLSGGFNFNVVEQTPLAYLPTSIPVDVTGVTASGNVDIGYVGDDSQITLVLDEFDGVSGDYALTGAAALRIINDTVQIDNLRLNTIANEITVSGEYQGNEIHLAWQLDAPVLDQFIAEISGSVQGSGQIDGPLVNPAISAAVQLQNLQRDTVSAELIDLSIAGTREQLQSKLQMTNITVGTGTDARHIDQSIVSFAGNIAAHTITANVTSDYGDLVLAVQGGVSDTSAPVWDGALTAASVRSEFGNWSKRPGASPLLLSADTITIPQMCWQLESTGLCVEIARAGGNQVTFAAALENYPLSEFNNAPVNDAYLISYADIPHLPEGINVDGVVNANLEGVLDFASGLPDITFSLSASEAVLRIASQEMVDAAIESELVAVADQRFDWDNLSINGRLQNGNWTLAGNAALSQQNVEDTNLGLNGLLESNLNIDADGNLDGTATASFAELGWIQAFLPELTAVSGSLTSEIIISGSLTAPLIAGELDLDSGTATISQLGITLTDIQSSVVAASSGAVQIAGAVASETGSINFTGDIQDLYIPSRQVQATLSGTNFMLANLPDVKLEVSPELQMTANSELINLTGSLDIPVLNLTLRELPETAVDVSRDTVIVSYPPERPELARSIAADQNTLFDIPVSATINLTLGDAVNVSGFGMQATLDGDLNIQQRVDGRNLTYGELSIVEGNYRLYGQTLELRQGKLLFFGAVDNPALDIRAVREVDGMTAGVLMNGTLKNIRSQLFSTPVLPDNDIIAMLVTGRPASGLGQQDSTAVLGAIASLGLDRGQGLTNQIRDTLGFDTLGINSSGDINNSVLTIGKYLTPDIFVHYGVGLFDRQSKVAIDYSLTEHIILQAESGEYQSIDLTYSIER